MAQDRLFQLDYLRRRRPPAGSPRCSAPTGSSWTYACRFRTIGLSWPHRRPQRRVGGALPAETREPARGLHRGHQRPDRRHARPPADRVRPARLPARAVVAARLPGDRGEFRWYLTGRFPVIVIPELAKRALGDGPLYRAFLHGEADDESILPPGTYPAAPRGVEPVGPAVGWPVDGPGSNNWVRRRPRTASRQAAGRQRSAHRLRRRLVLVRGGPSHGGSLPRRRHGLRRHAGGHVRPHSRASPGASPTTSARSATSTRRRPTRPTPAASSTTAAGSRPASGSRRSRSAAAAPVRHDGPLLAQRPDRGRPAAAGRAPHGPGVAALARGRRRAAG